MAFAVAGTFVLILVLILAGFFAFVTYNAVVALGQRINKAWANIDVALKQRFDELPNLVSAVRGVMGFEQDVLTRVTELRNSYSSAAPVTEQATTSEATSRAVRQLLATVEKYPELKSAANVLSLQAEIERLDGVIADRRELYNDSVARYNIRIRQLPAVLLAGLFGWRSRDFFAVDDGQRAVAPVDLTGGAST